MASFYPYSIGLITTGGVPDNSYTDLNLRVYPFAARSYTQVSKTNGRYFFGSSGTPMISGYYQLYDGNASAGSPLTTAQFVIGEPEAVIITGNQTIDGVKRFSQEVVLLSGTSTDTITARSDDGVTIDGVLIKESLVGSNITPYDTYSTKMGLLDNQIDVLTDEFNDLVITPYQESINKVRLMINGSATTGQVYTSWLAAQYYCGNSISPVASATRRMIIEVAGMGNAASSIIVTNDVDTDYFEDYVDVVGVSQSIVLTIPDDTMTIGALGRTLIQNLTIYHNNGASNPVFTNFKFNNCLIDLTVASVTFTNCQFDNCQVKINNDGDEVDATFTTMKGSGSTCNLSVGSFDFTKPKADF